MASDFGARFDMETDAALMLVLCALAWQLDKAGAWILAIGLMRYAFVAAAWRWRWLRLALPQSIRRKTVCVVQIVALFVVIAPVTPYPASAAVGAAALALLAWSFAVDVLWLARRRR
jgi:phosphatidylglycerophosphate synthase